ncbi:hypothetical protein JTB14_032715 [Gonioctena quinquepunctata]|nr:hypothetical protein JTB14_032715 [Gonioctena quinquepunctata]
MPVVSRFKMVTSPIQNWRIQVFFANENTQLKPNLFNDGIIVKRKIVLMIYAEITEWKTETIKTEDNTDIVSEVDKLELYEEPLKIESSISSELPTDNGVGLQHDTAFKEDDKFLDSLSDKLAELVSTKLAEKIGELENKLDKMNERIIQLADNNQKLQIELDQVQQDKKIANLRMYGIKETKNEKILEVVQQIFTDKLSLDLDDRRISSCYQIQPGR